jgi:hypothetical protein
MESTPKLLAAIPPAMIAARRITEIRRCIELLLGLMNFG